MVRCPGQAEGGGAVGHSQGVQHAQLDQAGQIPVDGGQVDPGTGLLEPVVA